jgi:hypothetical protein
MDTPTNMQVVGSELDHIEALRALLTPKLGSQPEITARLEISLGNERTIITVNEDQIVVRDEATNRVVAQGDWNLARAALAGIAAATS